MTETSLREKIQKIEAKFGLAFHGAMPNSVAGHREIRKVTQEILSIIESELPEELSESSELALIDKNYFLGVKGWNICLSEVKAKLNGGSK